MSNAAYREREAARQRALYAARKAAGGPLNQASPEALKRANRNKNARRRALTRGAQVVENVDREVVWERDGGICHLCSEPADHADWHLDHVVELVEGGEHSYANTAVSHPACNLAKEAARRRGECVRIGTR